MKNVYYSITILGTLEVKDDEDLMEAVREDAINRGIDIDQANDIEIEEVK